MLSRKVTLICLVCIFVVFSSLGYSKAPLIVNINNPNFRKLVVAIPEFKTDESASAEMKKLAIDGSLELGRLLNFSGLFNLMSEAAYKDLLKSKEGKLAVRESSVKGLEGVDLIQWKAIGVESLTIGSITGTPDDFYLEIRTADINRGRAVVGKGYRHVKKSEYYIAIRKYANALLRAYTGKPGIFSSKLVFVGRKHQKSVKQIYVCDFDGKNVVQVTSKNVPHLSPSWSPDGRFVTYTSYEDGNPDMFRYEFATGRKKKVSGRRGLNSGSAWANNGKLIAFTGSNYGDADIFVVDPSGGNRRVLIRGSGLDVDPSFSPDGKWLAFVSGRFGNPHIFRATLKWESDKVVRVTNDKRLTYAGWYNATPAWSPDSKKLAFAGYDRDTDRFDLFMMNHDGTNLERLTIRTGDNERPSWSPNGQMVVFHSNRTRGRDVKGVNQLFIMNRDGSGQRRLHTGLYESQTPIWGPGLE